MFLFIHVVSFTSRLYLIGKVSFVNGCRMVHLHFFCLDSNTAQLDKYMYQLALSAKDFMKNIFQASYI